MKQTTMGEERPDEYHIDYETYSPAKLKEVGAFKYIEHPDAEILIMCIAKNDEPPSAWSVLEPDSLESIETLMLYQEAVESGSIIWAHNAQFEFAATEQLALKTFKMPPPSAHQWKCTAALCRLAAIPSSLSESGEFLGIPMPKDKDGMRLINKFSIPRKPTKGDPRERIHAHDDPEDFKKFIEYCKRDVEAERCVHKKLAMVLHCKHPKHESFTSDLLMNNRGIPVNVEALRHAQQLIEEYNEQLIPRFREAVAEEGRSLTMPVTKARKAVKVVPIDDGFNPSQGEMMKVWLKEEGFTGDDLQADTVELWLNDYHINLTPKAQHALYLYSLVGSAAIKKIAAMLEMVCDDGYIRGGLKIYGAERTHRWTGVKIQPQNFARPTINFTRLAYHMVCNKTSLEDIESIFGDLYPVMVSVIRHFIQPHEDKEVLQADYSAIEARIVPWLMNDEDLLEMFRQDKPIYEMMAARIFHVALEDVNKDMRFLGKQSTLGCGYNMGAAKFRASCEKYGFTPPPEMVQFYKENLHVAFVTRQVNKIKNADIRNYEKKGKQPPAHHNIEYYKRKTCEGFGWTMPITPADDDAGGWLNRTYSELADRCVKVWRESNPKVVSGWKEIENAAKAAIRTPWQIFEAGKLQFRYMDILPDVDQSLYVLGVKLPSGHYLIYPKAEIIKDERNGWGEKIRFWGVLPSTNGTWGWCHTYGGKIFENCSQGLAGDIMREGVLAAEREGYMPFMLVHDEMLAIKQCGQTHERLCELICTMPDWAEGLPLKAEGSTIPFYEKG